MIANPEPHREEQPHGSSSGATADAARHHEGPQQPLVIACQNSSIDIVRALLDHGEDVNVRDATLGITPLITACIPGDINVVRLLIEKVLK